MTIDGVQVDLKIYTPPPEGYDEAVKAAEKLGAKVEAVIAPPPTAPALKVPTPKASTGPKVAGEAERFAAEVLARRKPATRACYAGRMGWIVRTFGRWTVSDLTPALVETEVQNQPGWLGSP